MAYSATVIQVMIASPGDVSEERDSIRKTIHGWNDLNAGKEKVVLLPVGWDTHSASDLSGRAQDQINGRLLHNCDLLVGVFWTRLGTPTGEYASGTVEEIKEHVGAGKTAMVYFSTRPVVPGSYEEEQYRGVLEFKKWCMQKGIITAFESIEDFSTKFRNGLQIILRDSPHLNSLTSRLEPIQSATANNYRTVTISELALDMLQNAAATIDGIVMVAKSIGGTRFSAGNKSYDVSSGQREIARHQAAVEELTGLGLIEDVGYKGEIFQVTHEGYEVLERNSLSTA